MKIKTFADSQGVSIDRMNRAAIWALAQTGREKPKSGGRYGGVDLTIEEQALCLQYLADHRKGKDEAPETLRYEQIRLGWLKTWIGAETEATDARRKASIMAVIRGLFNAKDRAWLDGACEGARNGDLLVELAYGASVDWGERVETTDGGTSEVRWLRSDGPWTGFTSYLLDQGFESPGWGIL